MNLFPHFRFVLIPISMSLVYLDKILNFNTNLTLKTIWGKNYSFLEKLYNKSKILGIQTSLETKIIINKKRKGNFEKLLILFNNLKLVYKDVEKKFMIWYREYDYKN